MERSQFWQLKQKSLKTDCSTYQKNETNLLLYLMRHVRSANYKFLPYFFFLCLILKMYVFVDA